MFRDRIIRRIIVGICFLAFVFNAANTHAKVFEANDLASYRVAIDSVNARAGGDTIKITGDIEDISYYVETITKSVTITANTRTDGSPLYTIKCPNLYPIQV